MMEFANIYSAIYRPVVYNSVIYIYRIQAAEVRCYSADCLSLLRDCGAINRQNITAAGAFRLLL